MGTLRMMKNSGTLMLCWFYSSERRKPCVFLFLFSFFVPCAIALLFKFHSFLLHRPLSNHGADDDAEGTGSRRLVRHDSVKAGAFFESPFKSFSNSFNSSSG